MTLNDLSFKYIRQEKEEGDYIFVTFSSWSDKMPSYFGESFLCSQNIESFLICQNTLNDWWHTEDIYKIYAESFIGPEHLKQIQEEAQELVSKSIS